MHFNYVSCLMTWILELSGKTPPNHDAVNLRGLSPMTLSNYIQADPSTLRSHIPYIDGLVQNCSNPRSSAIDLLQHKVPAHEPNVQFSVDVAVDVFKCPWQNIVCKTRQWSKVGTAGSNRNEETMYKSRGPRKTHPLYLRRRQYEPINFILNHV